jgi:hypothetical protein
MTRGFLSMTDIVNFVPLAAKVTVRGETFKLRGIELQEIGELIYRFPKLLELRAQLGNLNIAALAGTPAIVAAVIAYATDKGQDSEKGFANLALGERAKFLSKIVELTAPDGIGPFVDLLRAVIPEAFQTAAQPPAAKLKIRARPSSRRPTS